MASVILGCAATEAAGRPPHEHAHALADQVRRDAIEAAIETLQASGNPAGGPGSRAEGTAAAARARDWIEEALTSTGLLVERPPLELLQTYGGRRVVTENVVAHAGPTAGVPRLVLVAHLDARAAPSPEEAAKLGWDWARSPTPGADDNASGAAVLLEVARVLAPRLRAGAAIGVDFAWTAGEEVARMDPGDWMYNIGAEALADTYATDAEPTSAISVDMLLRPRPWGYALRVYGDGREGSSRLAEALEQAAALVEPGVELRTLVDPSFAWSDHGSFWARGMPAVFLIEDDFHHPRYHREADRYDRGDPFYDVGQAAAAARILTAAVVLLAGP